ncbi:cobalamin biosynthesis protein [Devosia sp. A449]
MMTTGTTLPQGARLVAGIGCNSAASADEIVALLERCLARLGVEASALTAIASHSRKSGVVALMDAASHFDVPLRLLADAELAEDMPTPSEVVFAAIGRSSIAEAVAAAAGPLVLAKQKSAYATCALALCPADFDALSFGQASRWSAAMAASRLSTSSAGP